MDQIHPLRTRIRIDIALFVSQLQMLTAPSPLLETAWQSDGDACSHANENDQCAMSSDRSESQVPASLMYGRIKSRSYFRSHEYDIVSYRFF